MGNVDLGISGHNSRIWELQKSRMSEPEETRCGMLFGLLSFRASFLGCPSVLGTVLSTLPFNLYNNSGMWVLLSSF